MCITFSNNLAGKNGSSVETFKVKKTSEKKQKEEEEEKKTRKLSADCKVLAYTKYYSLKRGKKREK